MRAQDLIGCSIGIMAYNEEANIEASTMKVAPRQIMWTLLTRVRKYDTYIFQVESEDRVGYIDDAIATFSQHLQQPVSFSGDYILNLGMPVSSQAPTIRFHFVKGTAWWKGRSRCVAFVVCIICIAENQFSADWLSVGRT